MTSNYYEFRIRTYKGRSYGVEIGYVVSDPDEPPCVAFGDTKTKIVEDMERFVAEAQAALAKARNLPDDPMDFSYAADRAGEYDPKEGPA